MIKITNSRVNNKNISANQLSAELIKRLIFEKQSAKANISKLS
nr:hypothetical protein [Mycoplasmopsis bovis]